MNTPYPASSPTTPLAALAKRWYLGVGLGLLGLAAGAGVSLLSPVTYVGESRVSVGSQSLDARVVAGYSLASQQLAADLSRYVNDQQAQGTLRPVLGASAGTVAGVAASPIPSSSVIRIEVTGTDGDAAARAATAVADSLVQRVNGLTDTAPQDLLAQYTALSQQVAQLQSTLDTAQSDLGAVRGGRSTPEEVAAVQQRVTDAESALSVAEVQQSALGERYRNAVTSTPSAAGLELIQPGTVTSDDQRSEAVRYGLAGLGGGLVLALGLATLAERRRAQRRAAGRRDDDDADRTAAAPRVDVRERVTGH
ncbi:hypothetical protein GTR02_06815 [Kineococcus sp. R8]|uniref:hypothetical protein n=1 Tax=Kineococcus siccus TaxID=2696567 RepID=UPI001411E8E8|nr:hypothetical protein [Kineococcus siccus]NAZ81527.1 hypothetical protein [Kineococcus siccus]